MKAKFVAAKEEREVLEIFGPQVSFLTPVADNSIDYCLMLGIIPPGVSVPLHSHPDTESFYILSGEVQVLIMESENADWLDMKKGDFVHMPGGMKHAWRNLSDKPVEGLITTTTRLGQFFREVGRIVKPGKHLSAPTPEQLQYFMQVADKYHHWLGSPEENERVGISILGKLV